MPGRGLVSVRYVSAGSRDECARVDDERGLTVAHQVAGFDTPTADTGVRAVWSGIRRRQGMAPPRKMAPNSYPWLQGQSRNARRAAVAAADHRSVVRRSIAAWRQQARPRPAAAGPRRCGIKPRGDVRDHGRSFQVDPSTARAPPPGSRPLVGVGPTVAALP